MPREDGKDGGRRLDTWKEIAKFFGKDERTVKRWEKERKLPVRRLPGNGRGGVYAYSGELTEWLESAAGGEKSVSDPAQPNTASAAGGKGERGRRGRMMLAWSAAMLVVVLGGAALPMIHASHGHASQHGVAQEHEADAEARNFYLKGRYAWNKRTPQSLRQAIDFFTQAIVRDPGYAEAYAGLADCYNLIREYTDTPASEAYPKAIAAAQRALALKESLAGAHRALAFAEFWWSWDAASAEREFRRSLQLAPEDAQTHHWYATFLLQTGRAAKAVDEINEAQRLDPASRSVLADKGLILYYAGQRAEGVTLLKQLEAMDPDFESAHRYLADIDFERYEDEPYLVEAKRAAELAQDQGQIALLTKGSRGFAKGGDTGMLREMLSEECGRYAAGQGGAFEIARIYERLGDERRALEYLNRSYADHEADFLAIRNDGVLAKMGGEAGYRDLLAHLTH